MMMANATVAERSLTSYGEFATNYKAPSQSTW